MSGGSAPGIAPTWSAAGDRLLSSSRDGTVRIWRADGRGEPFVLYASTAVNMAAWSADERHVVAALDDGTLIVWNEFTPLTGADDPALWAATSYCPALELRRRLLNFSDEQLRSDLARCVRRVREVRAGPARAR